MPAYGFTREVINQANPGVDAGRDILVSSLGGSLITLTTQWGSGVTAGVIALEGSPTGETGANNRRWSSLGTLSFSAGASNHLAINEAHRYVRARVTTAVADGSDATLAFITVGGTIPGGS